MVGVVDQIAAGSSKTAWREWSRARRRARSSLPDAVSSPPAAPSAPPRSPTVEVPVAARSAGSSAPPRSPTGEVPVAARPAPDAVSSRSAGPPAPAWSPAGAVSVKARSGADAVSFRSAGLPASAPPRARTVQAASRFDPDGAAVLAGDLGFAPGLEGLLPGSGEAVAAFEATQLEPPTSGLLGLLAGRGLRVLVPAPGPDRRELAWTESEP
ncbi:MAG: hypothetical protein LBL01_06590, partial [Bifidobacteriaceae bacterium]|nr:hypothetical protein [Bifidobacteriaceae bacterium]